MNSKHNQEHFFDQDFEVTYEDDPVFHYEDIPQQREFQTVDLKSQPKPKPSRQNKKKLQVPLQDDATILMDPIQNGTVTPRSRQKSQHWEENSPSKKTAAVTVFVFQLQQRRRVSQKKIIFLQTKGKSPGSGKNHCQIWRKSHL